VWAGVRGLAVHGVDGVVVVQLPVAEGWTGQPAYERVFGGGWRIVLASLCAFWVGDILNSFVLAKMKIAHQRPLAVDAHDRLDDRGRGRDSLIFYPSPFYGLPTGRSRRWAR
jgi:hypothetical protein